MVSVAVTGAAGSVGRVTLDALADHDLTPITHREHDDIDSVVLDVEEYEPLEAAFAGHRVVVHLAGNPSPGAAWDEVFRTNILGTYNVFEAAHQAGVDRVVFASTNHVHQMYNVSNVDKPETLQSRADAISPDAPFRPDSYYAVSKVAGEALGAYYADRHGMEVVNLRIGWLLTAGELEDQQSRTEDVARYARAMWLSPRDCRDGMGRSVVAPLPTDAVGVALVSANQERVLSITETMRTLGYHPRDDSAELLAEQ